MRPAKSPPARVRRGGLLSGKTQGSTTITKMLRKVADDADVKAVVVRIDGPGGSATASDLIWQETMRLRGKEAGHQQHGQRGRQRHATSPPWPGTKIFAEPGTITGSIGVIGGKLVDADPVRQAGHHHRVHRPRRA